MKYLLANRHKVSIVYTGTLFSGLSDVDLTRDRRVNIRVRILYPKCSSGKQNSANGHSQDVRCEGLGAIPML